MVGIKTLGVPRFALEFPFDAFAVITRPKGNPSLLDDFVHFGGQLKLGFFTDL